MLRRLAAHISLTVLIYQVSAFRWRADELWDCIIQLLNLSLSLLTHLSSVVAAYRRSRPIYCDSLLISVLLIRTSLDLLIWDLFSKLERCLRLTVLLHGRDFALTLLPGKDLNSFPSCRTWPFTICLIIHYVAQHELFGICFLIFLC